jgi:hypothetical protein
MSISNLGIMRKYGGKAGLEDFRARIKQALSKSGGRLEGAALILGISKASLKAYLAEDPVLAKARRALPGRPVGSLSKKKTKRGEKELDT